MALEAVPQALWFFLPAFLANPSAVLFGGGRPYDGPFGTVFSANITPDPETGIGKWSDDDIINAIRLGRRPNGERLVPVHPFTLFNGVAEEDLRALVAYLKMIRPVTRANASTHRAWSRSSWSRIANQAPASRSTSATLAEAFQEILAMP